MTNNTSSQTEHPPTRVFIVDDHPIFREGLVGVIRQQTALTVCGEAENASQALEAIRLLKPDLLLTDLSLPGKSGLDLLRELRAAHLNLPALVISMHDETEYGERVLRAGGQGYIMKQAGPDKVLTAISTVLAGNVYLSENLSSTLSRQTARRWADREDSPMRNLTPREFKVFCLIGEGTDDRKIAGNLHMSLKALSHHRAHIKAKLHLKNDDELVRCANRGVGPD